MHGTDEPHPAHPAVAATPTESEARFQEALRAVHRLDELVLREREAVATLDVAALEELAVEKQALADRLGALASSAADPPPEPRRSERTERLRAAAVQAIAGAEANLALMADAIDAIAGALGISRDAGTYDARARLIHRVRAVAGRNV